MTLALLCLSLAHYAQAGQVQQAPLSPAKAAASVPVRDTLQQDPSLVVGKLDNGLTYYIRPTAEPKGRASVRLYVKTGSLNEDESNKGISHFIEHLEFNGSRNFKRGELIPNMQRLGLGFGGDANAYTGFLQTVYMLDLPKLDEETVDFAMKVMRDFADGATLEADAIDKERGIIMSELKVRDSTSYRVLKQQMDFLLNGSKVAQYMPIGEEEFIMNGQRDKFLDYYGKHYIPGRMSVVISGDITPEQGKQWVEKYFGSMEAKEDNFKQELGALKDMGLAARVFKDPEGSNASVSIQMISPFAEKPDTVEQRLEDMPLEMAFSMLNRRLERMLEKAECPYIKAGAGKGDMLRVADMVSISSATNPDKWKPTLEAIEQEMRRACEYGFQPEELEEAKASMLNGLNDAVRSWPTVTSSRIAKGIVSTLDDNTVFTAPEEDLRVVNKGFATLTPELCHAALKKAWDADKARIVVSGKLGDDATDEAVMKAYKDSQQVPVQAYKSEGSKAFAYDDCGTPGKVAARQEIADLGITQLTLSNGVKVNLKPTDFSKNSISVKAQIDGGVKSMPKDRAGLWVLAPVIMGGGGLEKHSSNDLQRLLAGRTVGVGFDLDDKHFSLGGSTKMNDLELQLKLLVANILHPGYRPEAEVQFRRMIDLLYAQLAHDPDGVFQQKVPAYLYRNDVRLSFPEKEQLSARTSDQVREWLTPYLQNAPMEVTLTGDFKVDDVIPLLEKTIGAMPQRKTEFAKYSGADVTLDMAPWGETKTFEYPSSIDRTIVAQVRPCGDGMDKKRNRRLNVLKSVLRERLFDGIRAKLGEAYSPSVDLDLNPTYKDAARMIINCPGVKRNHDKVRAAINIISTELGRGQITEKEFECAIRPIITAAEKALRTNGYWMGVAADSQSEPENIELARNLINDLKSITLDELNVLAKEVFGNDKATGISIMPDMGGTKEVAPKAGESGKPQAADADTAAPAAMVPVAYCSMSKADADYVVAISGKTAQDPAWKHVADTLVTKHGGTLVVLDGDVTSGSDKLKKMAPRYLAIVGKPEELSRPVVTHYHRLTREFDADPFGDCIWGMVTGYTAADAQRIADAKEPLIIKRGGGTTNIDASRFEKSMCITDWKPFHVLEQEGYKEPTDIQYGEKGRLGVQSDKVLVDTPEGRKLVKEGMVHKFVEFMEKDKPQLLVTSSHATQYNLEMPFEVGLIVSSDNKFHILKRQDRSAYASLLSGVLFGADETKLKQFLDTKHFETIKPDQEPKVWLAAGNCLFGDVKNTKNSMAVTALSGYGCNQATGYTVPSWYGKSGWGTLGLFFNNHDASNLAEAWYLNNQFILDRTIREFPKLMNVQFNGVDINTSLRQDQEFIKGIVQAGYGMGQDPLGLVHDRDVMAFYGDPKWVARLDESHAKSPWHVTWQKNGLTVTANRDQKGEFAVWLPARTDYKSATVTVNGQEKPIGEIGVLTNDFILLRELDLKKGEKAEIRMKK
ncbi:peptidase m16 domain [Akkermansia glycaniphila]|uniref:Peptidase m16 domain n=2 Tax=Akkermansia glycaniphila TaxID=1679444 RepID=A0A1C7PDI9_9BACT|nr:M16 family metallopeptidase [Akkermansia glycaniphila]OCA02102.1 hypothetical protein AC781_13030 [Akkermansia glycaniphila]SEH94239.1 peptidase m16 domain [Akkermansia glycaniphila]